MKLTLFTLVSLSALFLAGLGACDDGPVDSLADGERTTDPGATAGGEDSTYNHANSPAAPGAEFEPADPARVRALGSPALVSRLHACGKLSVASLGDLLKSRGLAGGGQRPANTQSGQALFAAPDTAAALGAANYNGRVGEAPFASTSAVSKMFDIFTMASYDAVADNWTAEACPGIKLLEGGKFTKDGITCLLGKPATEEHVAIANDAITKNPTDGAKIAVAALLAAAHTCQ